MTLVDWLFPIAMFALLVVAVSASSSHMRGVTDFLVANRSAGRYLLTISHGIAGLGAITIVANLEMGYQAGFAMNWWGLSTALVLMVLAATGWVNYRFRRTRALTLAEFFERRYSRRFRIFAGLVAFFSGLINFGVFPAVGARFFIHYLGLPEAFALGPMTLETYPIMMIGLLTTACWFVLAGGQVAVMITDFIQGAFASLVFLIVVLYLTAQVGWSAIVDVLLDVPTGHSKINPFDTNYVEDFNFGYFLIGIVGIMYSAMSWQGTQAYNASAKTAHEGKMSQMLNLWRGMPQGLFMTLVPIIIFTVMHHGDWAPVAMGVQERLDLIENSAVRNQMRAPLLLAALLPVGLLGAFAAVVLGAFISTHNTYLHSWASIFIQDVVLPFRRKPPSPENHLRLLRVAIIGVALFIFFFSLLYKQSQAILLFFALTGAIFAGWSGSVLIGGLYTRWGNVAGAWAAGVTGVALTLSGFLLEQFNRGYRDDGVAFFGWLDWAGADRAERWAAYVLENLPNGQEIWGWSMWICTTLYVGVSLLWLALGRAKRVDLDRILHRGRFEIDGEVEEGTARTRGIWRIFAFTREFSRRDRVLYFATYGWTFLGILVFVIGTTYLLTRGVSGEGWARYDGHWITYWKWKLGVEAIISIVVVVWFTWGGWQDVRRLLKRLRSVKRNTRDDGFIEEDER